MLTSEKPSPLYRLGIDYIELSYEYEYEDNTQQEILEATKEMMGRLDNTF